MNSGTKSAVPSWYWVVAIVSLLWSLMGCAAFSMELFAQDAVLESMTEEQQKWTKSIPGWIYVVYAVAVTTGTGGSVGLLMRKRWTVSLNAICLVSVLIQMGYTIVIAGGIEVLVGADLILPILVIGIAGVMLWFSQSARAKGWLGDPSGHGTATQIPKANAAGPEGVESDGDTVADNDT